MRASWQSTRRATFERQVIDEPLTIIVASSSGIVQFRSSEADPDSNARRVSSSATVSVTTQLLHGHPTRALARFAEGSYDLVVLGTALRHGETKFLGPRTLGLVQSLRTPVLLIAR